MKLLRYGKPGLERPAVQRGETVLDVSSVVGDFDPSFWDQGGTGWLARRLDEESKLPEVNLAHSRLGPPVPRPSKIICIGLNYRDHIRETNAETPTEPVVFLKAPNTVIGPNDIVRIPRDSEQTDYEVELGVVIGSRCRYLLGEDEARKAIAGYAVSNDLSERAHQLHRGGQWTKGKSAETFNPLGPYLVTPDEVPDPQSLDLELRVNGEVRQKSSTAEMVFSVYHLVWYLSQFMVLEPGDLINTGTPHGVALGMHSPLYLKPGDRIETSISGLGRQSQVCASHCLEARSLL